MKKTACEVVYSTRNSDFNCQLQIIRFVVPTGVTTQVQELSGLSNRFHSVHMAVNHADMRLRFYLHCANMAGIKGLAKEVHADIVRLAQLSAEMEASNT